MSKASATRSSCHNCSFSDLCLPLGLNKEELLELESLVQKKREIKRHEHLFRMSDPFRRLYAVQKGTFKSYTTNTAGEEHINGFNLPAELLGLDGIHSGKHAMSVVALEDCSVCELPFEQLLVLASKVPHLQKQLFNIMSQNYTIHSHFNINSSAETRFATFLLNISTRLQERGFSARDFELSMTREDMGNYLGLATETISRLLKRLEEQNILSIACRRIHLKDLRALQAISCV